jgi:hypothetical protein
MTTFTQASLEAAIRGIAEGIRLLDTLPAQIQSVSFDRDIDKEERAGKIEELNAKIESTKQGMIDSAVAVAVGIGGSVVRIAEALDRIADRD